MKRKRGQNEGSIYKMSDGRWRAAVSLGWRPSGSGEVLWKRKVFTGKTRADVQQRLNTALHDQQRGLPIDSAKQTLGQFLNTWLLNTVKPSVRTKTYTSYEQMLRNHIEKSIPAGEWADRKLDAVRGLGRLELTKLTLPVLQEWMTVKVNAGNSPSLVRYLLVVLRIALNEALKSDLFQRNPATLATPPLVEKTEIKPFTPEEAMRFLQAARAHRLEALFTVALAIGLRSGEASGLKWSAVDLERGEIHVRQALQRVKGKGLALVPPKSEKSRRTIQLPDICVDALRTHRARQQAEREWAGSAWKDTAFVFTSKIGTPLDDRRVLLEFTRLVKVAGLPKQRFHDLRHACIS
jgi:integrase